MADRRRVNPQDLGGEWFVDTTCIDCDVARLLAPGLIEADDDGLSYFTRPPATPDEERMAWRALLSCPTASIGAPRGSAAPPDALPWELTPGVRLLGYTSPDSFGAMSWLVSRPGGNLMVDAPRWTPRLAEAIEGAGGVAHVLLTHRDDVADYDRYAERFGARVWIHEADRDAAPAATDVLTGDADIIPRVRALHVPGHTRGSVVFQVDDRFLFTGDSLYWSRELADLNAFRRATWHSWSAQTESLARLAEAARFEWVLPGHGGWARDEPEAMTRRLRALVERMRTGAVADAW